MYVLGKCAFLAWVEPTVAQNVMVFSVVTNVCDAQKSVRKIGLKLNTRKVKNIWNI